MNGNVFLGAGILLFVFLTWIATGGPARGLSFVPAHSQTADVYLEDSVMSSGNPNRSEREAARELAYIQDEIVELQRSSVAASRFGDPSPYKDLIMLSSGSASGESSADQEYLSITVSSRADEPINITGWRIESNARGASLILPEGVNLPRSSFVNDTEPIYLGAGDRAVVFMGESPVGMSFRENMCTGYLDQFQDFELPLTYSCPSPLDEFDRFYYGSSRTLDACRAYLRGTATCQIPRDTPRTIGDECQDFIDAHLNYNGCVDMHVGDRAFFTNYWRIYLERESEFFTKDHDTIRLLDAQGKTVDLVSY